MANKGAFKIHVGINFSRNGCDLAFGYKDKVQVYAGKFATKKRQNPVKIKTQVLLDENNNQVTQIGENSEQMYLKATGTDLKQWKYFENVTMSLQGHNFDQLKAANGLLCDAKRVFVPIFQKIQNVVKTFKKQINKSQIQWVVTANQFIVNNQRAKNNIHQYMVEAGLVDKDIEDQCLIISQADCATLTVFKYIQQNEDVKQNDTYIVVDAEEETVNIAVHKQRDNEGIEISLATTDSWGANYVDDKFIVLLEDIFTTNWINDYQKTFPNSYIELINNFSVAKSRFGINSEAPAHPVQLPNGFIKKCQENDMNLKNIFNSYKKRVKYFRNLFGCGDQIKQKTDNVQCELMIESENNLMMDARVWQCLFDSQINQIIDCIQSKNETLKRCRNLYLVGHFSTYCYFQQKMKNTFRNLTIQIANKTQNELSMAAVRGAAYFGITTDFSILTVKDIIGQTSTLPVELTDPNISDDIENFTQIKSKGSSMQTLKTLLIVVMIALLILLGYNIWQKNNTIYSLESQINTLENEIGSLEYKIGTLEADIITYKQTIRSLQNTSNEQEKEIKNLNKENDRMSEYNGILSGILQSIRNLFVSTTCENRNSENASCESDNSNVDVNKDHEIVSNVTSLQQENKQMLNTIIQQNNTIGILQSDNAKLQNEAKICKQISTSKNYFYEVIKKIYSLFVSNSNLSASEEEMRKEGDTIVASVNSSIRNNTSMQQINANLTKRITELEKEVKSLTTQLADEKRKVTNSNDLSKQNINQSTQAKRNEQQKNKNDNPPKKKQQTNNEKKQKKNNNPPKETQQKDKWFWER